MSLEQWWLSMGSAEQAAWVQAVGSVAAILVAVAVPVIGGWRTKRGRKQDRIEKSRNAVLRIYDLLLQLQSSLVAFNETHDPTNTPENPFVMVDPHDGDFQKPIPALIASIHVLDDMGPAAEPLQELMFKLIQMDHWMKAIPAIQRSGSPAFWINNIEDIRERVSELEVLATKAVDAIDNMFDNLMKA